MSVAEGPIARGFGLDDGAFAALLAAFAAAGRPEAADVVQQLNRGTALHAALGLPPRIIDALYAKAVATFNAGKPERAEDLFRTLCTLNGAVADHWLGYGICLRLRDALDGAADAFVAAAKVRPGWGVAHFHLLELRMRQGAWAAAAAELDKVDADIARLPERLRDEAERFRIAIARQTTGG